MKHKNKIFVLVFMVGIMIPVYIFWMAKDGVKFAPAFSSPGLSQVDLFPHPEKTAYYMKLKLDASSRTLFGESVITTENTSGRPLGELWLTIYPNAFRTAQDSPAPPEAYYAGFNEGWLQVEALTVNGQAVDLSYEGVSLGVILNQDLMSNEKIRIDISWAVKIPRMAHRFGTKDGIFMLQNFFPQLNVLTSDGWLKSSVHRWGEPFCFHSASYSVELNLPEAYRPIGLDVSQPIVYQDNGRQLYYLGDRNMRDLALVLAMNYSMAEKTVSRTKINCYTPSRNTKDAQWFLDKAGAILNYYNSAYGSYPYQVLNIVFVPMKCLYGMEHTGVLFMSDDYLAPGFNKETSLVTLAHEISLQWWYGLVGNDQLREPWLDEGLATWSSYKYLAAVEYKSMPNYSHVGTASLKKALYEYSSRDDYYQKAYQNGALFWMELERTMGEDKLQKVLRRYLADYKYKIATTNDLLNVIQKETSQDMNTFFQKWFGN